MRRGSSGEPHKSALFKLGCQHDDARFRRTDIIEDTGASLSPAVDVGQIEGAFLFGLGLWTSEKVVHHPHTGKLLTDDTWVRLFRIVVRTSTETLSWAALMFVHFN